jgi:hypothetical protein
MAAQEQVVDDSRSDKKARPLKCRWVDQCSDRFPRTFSIVCCIIVPLLFLIAVSIGCGHWLARIESPTEIVFNNAQLSTAAQLQFRLDIIANLTALTPRICWQLCLQQQQQNNDTLTGDSFEILQGNGTNKNNESSNAAAMETALVVVQELQSWLRDENSYDQELLLVNATDMYDFMIECGNRLKGIADDLANAMTAAEDLAPSPLTFNWNQCTPLGKNYTWTPTSTIHKTTTYEESLRPVRSTVCVRTIRAKKYYILNVPLLFSFVYYRTNKKNTIRQRGKRTRLSSTKPTTTCIATSKISPWLVPLSGPGINQYTPQRGKLPVTSTPMPEVRTIIDTIECVLLVVVVVAVFANRKCNDCYPTHIRDFSPPHDCHLFVIAALSLSLVLVHSNDNHWLRQPSGTNQHRTRDDIYPRLSLHFGLWRDSRHSGIRHDGHF